MRFWDLMGFGAAAENYEREMHICSSIKLLEGVHLVAIMLLI